MKSKCFSTQSNYSLRSRFELVFLYVHMGFLFKVSTAQVPVHMSTTENFFLLFYRKAPGFFFLNFAEQNNWLLRLSETPFATPNPSLCIFPSHPLPVSMLKVGLQRTSSSAPPCAPAGVFLHVASKKQNCWMHGWQCYWDYKTAHSSSFTMLKRLNHSAKSLPPPLSK